MKQKFRLTTRRDIWTPTKNEVFAFFQGIYILRGDTDYRVAALTISDEISLMVLTHRDKIFGQLPPNTFMWCLHCERTYLNGEYREADESIAGLGRMQLCPYDGCDGDAVTDSMEWREVREDHPDYPEKPTRNTVYGW